MISEKPQRSALIGSSGPFSLINAAAFIKQLGHDYKGVHVFDYQTFQQSMLDCEKWLCEILGMSFEGSITGITYNAEVIAGQTRLQRLISIPTFNHYWRTWGRNKLPFLKNSIVSDLILPYRVTLDEAFLASLLPGATLHFVPDGFLMNHARNIKLTRPWQWRGLYNPFDGSSRHPIWCPSGLLHSLKDFSETKLIEDRYFDEVYDTIWNDQEFASWLDGFWPERDKHEYSLFPLQNYDDCGFLNTFFELDIYHRIIMHELKRNPHKVLIVKPHPRDNNAKVHLLESMTPPELKDRVIFMRLEKYASVPLEVFLNKTNITKLVGMCSTALLTGKNSPGMEIEVFSSPDLPEFIDNEIKRMATAAGTDITLV